MAPRSSLSPVREWRLQLLLFLSPYWGICRRQIVFKVWIDIDSCACDATPVQRRVTLAISNVRQFAILKVKSWYCHAFRIPGPLSGGIYQLPVVPLTRSQWIERSLGLDKTERSKCSPYTLCNPAVEFNFSSLAFRTDVFRFGDLTGRWRHIPFKHREWDCLWKIDYG